MKGDSVTTALDLVREEIAAVVAQLNHEGMVAFQHSRYEEARRLGAQGQQLHRFTDKLRALQEEWVATVEEKTRERVLVNPDYSPPPAHTKGPWKNLRITLPDGRVVQRPTAAAAFVDVLRRLGMEQVRSLQLKVSGVPLVATSQHPKYAQRPCGPWWICTHSNTLAKKELLEKVGKALHKPLTVDVI